MVKTAIMNIVHNYAQVVQQRYGKARMWLFGSYAKGTYHEDSDIDLAVIFDYYEDNFDREVELMNMRHGIDSRIEPHAFMECDFTPDDPLAYEVMKYGIEIK
jgi:predicted nucleotidyltransferase